MFMMLILIYLSICSCSFGFFLSKANNPDCKCIPQNYPCEQRGHKIYFNLGKLPSSCLPGLFLCCDKGSWEEVEDDADVSFDFIKAPEGERIVYSKDLEDERPEEKEKTSKIFNQKFPLTYIYKLNSESITTSNKILINGYDTQPVTNILSNIETSGAQDNHFLFTDYETKTITRYHEENTPQIKRDQRYTYPLERENSFTTLVDSVKISTNSKSFNNKFREFLSYFPNNLFLKKFTELSEAIRQTSLESSINSSNYPTRELSYIDTKSNELKITKDNLPTEVSHWQIKEPEILMIDTEILNLNLTSQMVDNLPRPGSKVRNPSSTLQNYDFLPNATVAIPSFTEEKTFFPTSKMVTDVYSFPFEDKIVSNTSSVNLYITNFKEGTYSTGNSNVFTNLNDNTANKSTVSRVNQFKIMTYVQSDVNTTDKNILQEIKTITKQIDYQIEMKTLRPNDMLNTIEKNNIAEVKVRSKGNKTHNENNFEVFYDIDTTTKQAHGNAIINDLNHEIFIPNITQTLKTDNENNENNNTQNDSDLKKTTNLGENVETIADKFNDILVLPTTVQYNITTMIIDEKVTTTALIETNNTQDDYKNETNAKGIEGKIISVQGTENIVKTATKNQGYNEITTLQNIESAEKHFGIGTTIDLNYIENNRSQINIYTENPNHDAKSNIDMIAAKGGDEVETTTTQEDKKIETITARTDDIEMNTVPNVEGILAMRTITNNDNTVMTTAKNFEDVEEKIEISTIPYINEQVISEENYIINEIAYEYENNSDNYDTRTTVLVNDNTITTKKINSKLTFETENQIDSATTLSYRNKMITENAIDTKELTITLEDEIYKLVTRPEYNDTNWTTVTRTEIEMTTASENSIDISISSEDDNEMYTTPTTNVYEKEDNEIIITSGGIDKIFTLPENMVSNSTTDPGTGLKITTAFGNDIDTLSYDMYTTIATNIYETLDEINIMTSGTNTMVTLGNNDINLTTVTDEGLEITTALGNDINTSSDGDEIYTTPETLLNQNINGISITPSGIDITNLPEYNYTSWIPLPRTELEISTALGSDDIDMATLSDDNEIYTIINENVNEIVISQEEIDKIVTLPQNKDNNWTTVSGTGLEITTVIGNDINTWSDETTLAIPVYENINEIAVTSNEIDKITLPRNNDTNLITLPEEGLEITNELVNNINMITSQYDNEMYTTPATTGDENIYGIGITPHGTDKIVTLPANNDANWITVPGTELEINVTLENAINMDTSSEDGNEIFTTSAKGNIVTEISIDSNILDMSRGNDVEGTSVEYTFRISTLPKENIDASTQAVTMLTEFNKIIDDGNKSSTENESTIKVSKGSIALTQLSKGFTTLPTLSNRSATENALYKNDIVSILKVQPDDDINLIQFQTSDGFETNIPTTLQNEDFIAFTLQPPRSIDDAISSQADNFNQIPIQIDNVDDPTPQVHGKNNTSSTMQQELENNNSEESSAFDLYTLQNENSDPHDLDRFSLQTEGSVPYDLDQISLHTEGSQINDLDQFSFQTEDSDPYDLDQFLLQTEDSRTVHQEIDSPTDDHEDVLDKIATTVRNPFTMNGTAYTETREFTLLTQVNNDQNTNSNANNETQTETSLDTETVTVTFVDIIETTTPEEITLIPIHINGDDGFPKEENDDPFSTDEPRRSDDSILNWIFNFFN